MVSLEFFIELFLRLHYGSGVESASNGNVYQGKGGRCVGLNTLPQSCADCWEIWEPQTPGSFRKYPGLYRNCFTLRVSQNKEKIFLSKL